MTWVAATKTLYFSASGTGNKRSLWAYEPLKPLSVTNPVMVSGSAGSDPKHLFAFGNKVIFSGKDSTNGRELWSGDKGAGAAMILNLASRGGNTSADAYPHGFVLKDPTHFYFSASNGQSRFLYLSDGSAAGTTQVSTIATQPDKLTMMDGMLYFVSYGLGHPYLWRSDGTAAGTTGVDMTAQAPQAYSPVGLLPYRGTLYFFGEELTGTQWHDAFWSYTPGETHEKRIVRFEGQNAINYNTRLVPGLDGTLYFALKDRAHDRALWHSDGTEAGTRLVHDINTRTKSSAPSADLRSETLGAYRYHLALSSETGGHTALYVTHLSDSNTSLVRGDANCSVDAIAALAGELYGLEYDRSGNRIRLWKLQPGSTTPQILKEHTGVSPVPGGLVASDDSLYIVVADRTTPTQTLSRYHLDTGNMQDIYTEKTIEEVTVVDGAIFFASYESTKGFELWRYDPATGTKQTYDINTVPNTGASSSPSQLTPLDGWLYFFAVDDGANFIENLWRIRADGTGLQKVSNFTGVGIGAMMMDALTVTEDAVYFRMEDPVSGQEVLWRYRPGEALAEALSDVVSPRTLTPIGRRLYFVWDDPAGDRIGWAEKDQRFTEGSRAKAIVGTLADRILYTQPNGSGEISLWIGDGSGSDTRLKASIEPQEI